MRPQHLSPFQFEQQPNGGMRVKGFPGHTLTVEEQGRVTGRDWQTELDLPTYFEEWETMARIRSGARRGRVTFVLFDESPTRLEGHPRMQPNSVVLPTSCSLELGHSGLIIGGVYGWCLGVGAMRGAVPSLLNVTLPAEIEGDYLIGQAILYDSALAEKAMEGLKRGIFTHTCPVVWSPDGAPVGTGALIQASLVPGDFPGCEHARVIKFDEE